MELCTLDAKGRPLKGVFYPFSTPSGRSFDVLVPTNRFHGNGRFETVLQFLNVGDELAFRLAPANVEFAVTQPFVDTLTIVTSADGIAPALQMLRILSNNKQSALRRIHVVWVNEKRSDFAFSQELDLFERKFHGKLAVSRVVDPAVNNLDQPMDYQLHQVLKPYQAGNIAITCVPRALQWKITKTVKDLGYPVENLLAIPNIG